MQKYEKLVKLRVTWWRYEAWAELCGCLPNTSEPNTSIYQISHHLSPKFSKSTCSDLTVCFSHLSGTLQLAIACWPAKDRAAWPRLEISGWLETFTGEISAQFTDWCKTAGRVELNRVRSHVGGGWQQLIWIATYKNSSINSLTNLLSSQLP